MKFFIKTFGCQQNVADSERIEAAFTARGMKKARGFKDADYVVINTCMVRHSAENRVYGLVENLSKIKDLESKIKIIVTGCMVGLAYKDKSGKYLKRLKTILPQVDEFMPIEEVGFDFEPVRTNKKIAFVPISNGCNNFCTYCVVPLTRGREISRPYKKIMTEAKKIKERGFKNITLLGQNVNSYGSDLIKTRKKTVGVASEVTLREADCEVASRASQERRDHERQNLPFFKPIYVKHLGRYRIPTLFPYLLEDIAKLGFEKVDFISSNPWDFSDELIEVVARNKNITRTIHLPVQSGDDNVLKRMNRWYSSKEYLNLISKIKDLISDIKFTTDIIVGFCGETEKEFQNTVKLCKRVGFNWAYVAMYSPRPMTAATKVMQDDIPYAIKKKRWLILDNLINKPHLRKNKNHPLGILKPK